MEDEELRKAIAMSLQANVCRTAFLFPGIAVIPPTLTAALSTQGS